MKFLFNAVVMWPTVNQYYNIYEIEEGKYSAELLFCKGSPFPTTNIWKVSDEWVTDSLADQYIAERIGEDIEQYLRTLRK
jgi:hypothetical protein